MSLPLSTWDHCVTSCRNLHESDWRLTRWTDLDTVLPFPDPVEFILLVLSLYWLLFCCATRSKLHINIHTEALTHILYTELSTSCYQLYLLNVEKKIKVNSPGFSFTVTRLKMVGCREKQGNQNYSCINKNNIKHISLQLMIILYY